MALTHLLDTSVFSQPIKSSPLEAVLNRWERIGERSVCTSAICLAELKQGLEQRASKTFWRRYHELLEDRYPVLSFDANTASTFAQINAELKKLGQPKPVVDLLIAATAKQHGLILATLNLKDFEGVPGLAVEHWGD